MSHYSTQFGFGAAVVRAAEGTLFSVATTTESKVGVEGTHPHIHKLVLPSRVITVITAKTSGFTISTDGEPLIVDFVKALEAFSGELVFFFLGQVGVTVPESGKTEV